MTLTDKSKSQESKRAKFLDSDRQTDRQIQTDRQPEYRQTDRHIVRQTETDIYRQKYRHRVKQITRQRGRAGRSGREKILFDAGI